MLDQKAIFGSHFEVRVQALARQRLQRLAPPACAFRSNIRSMCRGRGGGVVKVSKSKVLYMVKLRGNAREGMRLALLAKPK